MYVKIVDILKVKCYNVLKTVALTSVVITEAGPKEIGRYGPYGWPAQSHKPTFLVGLGEKKVYRTNRKLGCEPACRLQWRRVKRCTGNRLPWISVKVWIK